MTKEERAEKWDREVILCRKCNERRCMRGDYIRTGIYHCKECELLYRSTYYGHKWDHSFITCKYHPERRCNRSYYIKRKRRLCASCRKRTVNGNYRLGVVRNWSSEQSRWQKRSYRRTKKIKENVL